MSRARIGQALAAAVGTLLLGACGSPAHAPSPAGPITGISVAPAAPPTTVTASAAPTQTDAATGYAESTSTAVAEPTYPAATATQTATPTSTTSAGVGTATPTTSAPPEGGRVGAPPATTAPGPARVLTTSCQALGSGYVYGGIAVTGTHTISLFIGGKSFGTATTGSYGGSLKFAPGTSVRCTAVVDGAQVDLGATTAV